MQDSSFVFLILGMGIVTFLPRWIPLFFLSKRKMAKWFVEWLDLIPVSILSALLIPSLLTHGSPRFFTPFSTEMLVALPTFIFAYTTRSLGGTLILGMALYWGAGIYIGNLG